MGGAAAAWVATVLTVATVATVGCLPRHGVPPQAPVVPARVPIEPFAPPVDADMDSGPRPPPPYRPFGTKSGNPYLDRFASLWNTIHDPSNGYFSADGVPYHAVETLDVDAPPNHLDYGHKTTAETYSYYVWLEARC